MTSTTGETPDDERLRRMSTLLREARLRIPPQSASLGNVLRLPSRVGKRVSQEEIAETLGVSRNWYALLENGRLPRPSLVLLERACNALIMDERQRADVFVLAVPEISSRVVEMRHAAILQASTQLRKTAKRLWAASSVDEALLIAAEESTQHFDDAALVLYVHRLAEGRWRHPPVVDRGIGSRNAHLFEELASSLPPSGFDEVALFPALANPGDVGTRDSFRLTSVRAAYEAAVTKHKLQRTSFLHARIRTRAGDTAGITVKHETEHAYSESQHAVMSAISSLTSLVLS